MFTSIKKAKISQFIFVAFNLLLFAILLLGSKQLSLTSDEPPHIAHGYIMLKTGDTWALTDHRHPPLSNMVSAIPLLLQPEQPDPALVQNWDSDFVLFVRTIWPKFGSIERLAYVTRYPNILLALLLLSLIIRWTRETSHHKAAIFSALLFLMDPTMLAHAQLNTTDLSLSFFAFATMYFVDRVSRERRIIYYAYIGLSLGCAMAVKASGLILLPVVFTLVFLQNLQFNTDTKSKIVTVYEGKGIVQFLTGSFLIILFSVICIVAVYAVPRLSSSELNISSSLMAHIDLLKLTLSERNRSAFLAGEIRQGGWWWYFPFAFLIKTPLPSVIITISLLLVNLSRPKVLFRKITHWLFPAVYIFLSIRSNLNIGFRHLLPIFPFIYLAAGCLLYKFINRQTKGTHVITKSKFGLVPKGLFRIAILCLLVWQAVDVALVYPYFIAYFNVIVGGPAHGYRYLVDSNVDWGQSFLSLKQYLQTEEIDWTWLSYYTWIDPNVYGVDYRPLPPSDGGNTFSSRFNPQPGVYAISATTLQGVMVADPDLYDWFRHMEPDAQPGYGLMVYKVESSQEKPGWVAQCTKPAVPLLSSDIASGFGIDDLRMISFDCENAWLYPHNGQQSGWYVFHKDIINNAPGFLNNMLAYHRLSYQQSKPGRLPAFDIYEKDELYAPSYPINSVFGEHKLTLTGYTLPENNIKTGTSFDITTIWSVYSVPDRPLSLMLHVTHNETGETYVGDGLGVPVTEWRESDLLIQRHYVTLSPNSSPGTYVVSAGVYWLDNLERWEPVTVSTIKNNAVVLSQITVE